MSAQIIIVLAIASTAIIYAALNLIKSRGINLALAGEKGGFVDQRSMENHPYYLMLIKIVALLFFCITFFKYFFPDSFILVINGGFFNDIYYKSTDVSQSILRWGLHICYVVYPMAAFFNSRLFKNIAIFLCLPFVVAAALNFDTFITYYMADGGRGIYMPQGFREFYLALELVLALAFPLILIVCGNHFSHFKNLKEALIVAITIPFVAMRLCPVTVPQSIIGYTGISFGFLSSGGILWLLLIFAEVYVLNGIFRFKDYRSRYMLCMFLALSAFTEYNMLTLMGFNIRRLPFQLCNLGTYFFVIALLIKNKKFFNFVYLANITGAVIAIVAPDATGGFAEFWNFHYIVEHTLVLVVPLMCMLLRLFPRPQKSALRHLTVGFTCYFLFCLILGTILNGITDITGQPKVNFFYIFDVNLAALAFPSLAPLTTYTVVFFKRFVFYPFFQTMIYLIFWFFCSLLYIVSTKLYAMIDDHFELRLARINLYEKITKKKSKAIREFVD